jgi:hypothetical protein
VIIYNNYLYITLEFKYPVFLVTWHLSFAVRVPLDPVSNQNLTVLHLYQGPRHPCPPADDTAPGWRQRRSHDQRHVHTIHPAHRSPLFWESHPQQHGVSLSECVLHPNAQGESFFTSAFLPSV